MSEECSLCKLAKRACISLGKTDSEKTICQELVDRFSKGDYDIESLLKQIGEKLGVDEKKFFEGMRKEIIKDMESGK